MIVAAVLLLSAADLGSPHYRAREAATDRLERFGTSAIPVTVRLMNSRDAEVRNRARRVFRRVALARTPGDFPHYRALAESLPSVVGCPKRWSSSLKYRAHIALDDAYRRSDFRSEPDGSEGWSTRDDESARLFARATLDRLVCAGVTTRFAQRWANEAAKR